MYKKIVIGLIFLLLIVGFSGCVEENNNNEINNTNESNNSSENNNGVLQYNNEINGFEVTGDTDKLKITNINYSMTHWQKPDTYYGFPADYLNSGTKEWFEWKQEQFLFHVYITAKNIAGEMINSTEITIRLYDYYNNYLTSKTVSNQYLKTSGRWEILLSFNGNEFLVEEEDGYGYNFLLIADLTIDVEVD